MKEEGLNYSFLRSVFAKGVGFAEVGGQRKKGPGAWQRDVRAFQVIPRVGVQSGQGEPFCSL